ncbi:RHS repeat-associated core domain-containing protein, partial [bacterium]|nr:RHS repeat-associated core domain-containing protein [bacterium]
SITYPAPVSKTISYQYNSLDQLKTVVDGTTQLAEYDYDTGGRLSGVSLANGLNSVLDYSLSGQLTNLSHHQNGMQLVGYIYRYNALGQRDQVHETRFDPYLTFLPSVFKEPTQELLQGMGDGLLESSETGYPPPLPEALEETEAPQNEGMEPYPPPPVEEEQTSFLRQAWDFLVELFSTSQTVSASYEFQNGYPPPPEPDDPPLPDEQVIDYVYDPLGRLVEAAYSNGPDYVYEYDKVGNRTAQIVDSATTVYQYDAADRLTNAGGTAYTWDDNGNLLGDGVYSYGYDTANRLVSAGGLGQSYGFAYDGLGNRYQQTVGGQTNTYTLDLVGSLSQVLNDGEFSYDYGLGRISQQQGGNSEYFLNDALGSVRQIANSNGTLIYRQNFDPFGNQIGSEGNGSSSYGYAGEWTDGIGLQHLRARYYAPQQGRFTSTDPFPGILSEPASLTPYTYALNNPVMYTDPSGEYVE